jgi:hypothetical protein
MNIRKNLNVLLEPRGYQIVKTWPEAPGSHPEFYRNGKHSSLENCMTIQRTHLWIVSPPKSGSTWLSVTLLQLLGWQQVSLTTGYERREQEVDVPPSFYRHTGNILSPHQHCRASQPTLDFIQRFKVTPIIQTRNIFDSVVSMRDHLTKENLVFSMAYFYPEFLNLEEEKQYDFIIALCLPWYFNFYASWYSAVAEGQVNPLFVAYEDLIKDTPGELKKILAFLQEKRSPDEIAAAIEHAQTGFTRKNVGVAGRGESKLNDRQKDRIREMRAFYPRIDFSAVGLD